MTRRFTLCSTTSVRSGPPGAKPMLKTPISRPLSPTCWRANSYPVRVVGFNLTEGWSRDVSEDVARELRQRCPDHDRELPEFMRDFVERCEQPRLAKR